MDKIREQAYEYLEKEYMNHWDLDNEHLEEILRKERWANKEFDNRKKIISDEEFDK